MLTYSDVGEGAILARFLRSLLNLDAYVGQLINLIVNRDSHFLVKHPNVISLYVESCVSGSFQSRARI